MRIVSETSGTILNAPTFKLEGFQKTKRKRKVYEKIFEETVVENFPKKKIANEVQEAQRVPYRINPRRNMSRHILIKLTKLKHKERMLKAARGNNK